MSDNSEMLDAKETSLAAVIDDSCTVQYIEITPLDRPSDDCYKSECIDSVVEVKPEDLQDVKQEPADQNVSETDMPKIDTFSPDRPSDNCSLWLFANDDCYNAQSIDRVIEFKPEDLQDVKQEPADEIDKVRF